MNTVEVKRAKSKEMGCTDKAQSLCHSALGYQSTIERLLADISFQVDVLQFKS